MIIQDLKINGIQNNSLSGKARDHCEMTGKTDVNVE